MAVLFGCATVAVQQLDTTTGKPEVTVNAPKAAIVEYIMSWMLTQDYMIKSQTDNVLVFFQSTTVTEDVNLLTTRTVSAENRVTFNLVNSSSGVRVMVSMVTIKNPNTSFEALSSDWSRGWAGGDFQLKLDIMKYEFETANPGTHGISITTYLGKPGVMEVAGTWGPAVAAGLQAKDLILSIDGNPMTADRVGNYKLLLQQAGTTHQLLIRRQKQQLTLDITYAAYEVTGKKPAQAQAPAAPSGPTMDSVVAFESLGLSLKGYQVVEIVANGPADKAGLKIGDVLTAIDGDSVPNSVSAIASRLIGNKASPSVVVTVKRGQEEVTAGIIKKKPNN